MARKIQMFKNLEVGAVVTYQSDHPLDKFRYEGHVVNVDEEHATIFIPDLIEYVIWDGDTDCLFHICR